jgi:CRP-like cAMP-binding protein
LGSHELLNQKIDMPQRIQNDSSCDSCQTGEGGFFCFLEKELLETVDTKKLIRDYKKGEVVFDRGDTPKGLFCLVSGLIKIETENAEGKTHILRLVGPGQSLGYRSLFSQEAYQARALAHDTSRVCFVPKVIVENLVAKSPQLALKFLSLLSEDVKRAEERLCSATDKSTSSRIADTILFLDKHYTPDKPWTRREIADWAGTSPETVMRTLSQFEEQGFIVSEGKRIKLLKEKDLQRISNSSF